VLERTFVKAVICVVLLVPSSLAHAQEGEPLPSEGIAADDDARASVEMSLSVSPEAILAGGLGSGGLGSGGLGGLANGAYFPLALDFGFALAPATFLVVGLGGSYSEGETVSSWQLSVPLSVLFYLEEPRVGRVLPTFRVGATVSWFGARQGPDSYDYASGRVLARGGVTWMAARWIALRAEVGASGGVSALTSGSDFTTFSFGLEASLAVVLRV
jgi:hypothetical protein